MAEPKPAAQLGLKDVAYANFCIADLSPAWSVELHEAFPGEARLMLMPEAADDAIGPTFVLQRQEDCYRLDQYQWDVYSELGAYRSLQDAMADIRRRLTVLDPPPSLLRH